MSDLHGSEQLCGTLCEHDDVRWIPFLVGGFLYHGSVGWLDGHGLVSGYPSCHFPTRVSLQSFLCTNLSFSVSRFPSNKSHTSLPFTLSPRFMKYPQCIALGASGNAVTNQATAASDSVRGQESSGSAGVFYPSCPKMVSHLKNIVADYEERLREKPNVPKLSHGRRMLCAGGGPNRMFLRCLLT